MTTPPEDFLSLISSPDRAPILLQRMGVTIRLMTSAAETNGGFTLLDYTAPSAFAGPQPHYHKRMTELFYVLEGKLSVRAGDNTFVIGKNELVRVPPGLLHTFATSQTEAARFLVLLTPGGMENYFLQLDELVKNAPVWPLPDMSPVIALAERYDTFS